jgi:tRNA uridine 5-carbamoylmethylation protein Kti12
MKTLYVMVGLPGTGKSTLVNSLIRDGVFVYSTDALIEEWSAAAGWNYNIGFDTYIRKATKQMDADLLIAIDENRDIIWDQTNLSSKKRKAIVSRVPKDYKKECHAIKMPSGDSQKEDWEFRLGNRPGKTIPKFILESMMQVYTLPNPGEGFGSVIFYDMYGNKAR